MIEEYIITDNVTDNENCFRITTRNDKGHINGYEIPCKIFNEELIDYTIQYREELIDILRMYISEAGNDSSKELMKEDLKYLINLPDYFVYSNINTNEYVANSDNKELFSDISRQILEMREKVINN